MSRRSFVVHESFGGGSVTFEDSVSPLFRNLVAVNPNAAKRALRHVGFHAQSELKAGIRQGSIGGTSISPQSILTSKGRAALQSNRIKSDYTVKGKNGQTYKRTKTTYKNHTGSDIGRHLRKKKRYTGRLSSKNQNLARAIGYQVKPDRVTIGWLSRSAARWGRLVQKGQTIAVTPRMRRYYFSIGLPLKASTRQIVMKPSPFVEPYFRANRRKLIHRFETRFLRNLLGVRTTRRIAI